MIVSTIALLLALAVASVPFYLKYQANYQQDHLTLAYRKQVQTPIPTRLLKNMKAYNKLVYQQQQNNTIMDLKPRKKILHNIQPKMKNPMGYVKIPSIKLNNMVMYWGDDDEILSKGVGIIPWSSLPSGGKNTMSAISGHTDKQQIFFDNIRYLKKGDIIYVTLKGQTRAYAMTHKKVVNPKKASSVKATYVQKNKEQIVLITCTPIITHTDRLLVYAKRVPMPDAKKVKNQDRVGHGQSFESKWEIISVIAFLLILIMYLHGIFGSKHDKREER